MCVEDSKTISMVDDLECICVEEPETLDILNDLAEREPEVICLDDDDDNLDR